MWVFPVGGGDGTCNLGKGSTTARTTSPSPPDIYLTLGSNKWRLQRFWKGMLEFYFKECFVFPIEDWFWQGCYSKRCSFLSTLPLSIYLCPVFISILYFSLRYCLFLTASPLFDELWRFCITKHTRNSSHKKKGQTHCQGALKNRAAQQQINVVIKWESWFWWRTL